MIGSHTNLVQEYQNGASGGQRRLKVVPVKIHDTEAQGIFVTGGAPKLIFKVWKWSLC